jgi:hypothetical protein
MADSRKWASSVPDRRDLAVRGPDSGCVAEGEEDMASMTPEQEAADALEFGSRDHLSPEVQAIYDRLVEERRARGAPAPMRSVETEGAGRRVMDDVDPTTAEIPKSVLRRLRRIARRKCRARAAAALIAMPVALFFGIINVIASLFPKDGPGSVVEALEGAGNILMSLVGTISDGVGAFRGDPLIVAGTVTERTIAEREWWPDGALVRLLFGYDLEIEAKRVFGIRRNGIAAGEPERQVPGTVESTRHLVRRLAVGDAVVLVCNSQGRALARVSDVFNEAEGQLIADAIGSFNTPR